MATLKTISAALKLIDTKKENLKKAYDDLQSQSSMLSSFSLNWSDIEAHFSSMQNSLTQRFNLLQSLESQRNGNSSTTQNPSDPSSSFNPLTQKPKLTSGSNALTRNPEYPSSSLNTAAQKSKETSLPIQKPNDPSCSSNPMAQDQVQSVLNMPWSELKALCERMDAKGLRDYVSKHLDEKHTIKSELSSAIRCARDPAAMVLDAMDGFYGASTSKDSRNIRRSCILLLVQLRAITLHIGYEVIEKAKRIASEWMVNLKKGAVYSLETLGFLHFVASYGLASEYSVDDLVEFASTAAGNDEVPELCRVLGLTDRVPDLVQKLKNKGSCDLAVKYIFEFDLAEKIPPVPILEAYVEECKKLTEQTFLKGNNSFKTQLEATSKEIEALKSVIKTIERHKLDSLYPIRILRQRIEQLKKQKADKRPLAPPAVKVLQQNKQKKKKPKQKPLQQHHGNKRLRTTAPMRSAVPQMVAGVGHSALYPYQHPHAQSAGLLPDHSAQYLNVTSPVVAYTNSLPGSYGTHVGYSGNPSMASSSAYSQELHVPPSYYDGQATYGGYGVPSQYNPSFYPR